MNLDISKWNKIKSSIDKNKKSRQFYDLIADKVKNGEEVIIQDEDRKVAFLSWQNNELREMPIVIFQKRDS